MTEPETIPQGTIKLGCGDTALPTSPTPPFADQEELKQFELIFSEGEMICKEGDDARDLYLLVEGQLDIIKRGKKITEINEPGAFFGELSFLLGTKRIASVVAAKATTVLRFPCTEKDALRRKYPDLAQRLNSLLAQRLHDTTTMAQGFRDLCDLMPDAAMITDPDLRVISWNRAAENLYGRSWELMRGKSIIEIYDNQAAFLQFMDEVTTHKAVAEKTLKINRPGEDWFFVSTSAKQLEDPGGDFQGYLLVSRDTTHLRKLEQKNRQITSWLAPLIVLLCLVTGGLLWRTIRPTPQPPSQVSTPIPLATHFIDGIQGDTAALRLALRPALAQRSTNLIPSVLAAYANAFQPDRLGISGLLVLNADRLTLGIYPPTTNTKGPALGDTYEGELFAGTPDSPEDHPVIYLVSRPDLPGRQGVDLLVPLEKTASGVKSWLAYRLEMPFIETTFNLSLKDLAEIKL
ncbi:MAG: cyclic nucleotide-binding domain-containing protein [Proteobacteria bacterium]|nr:cyclic nucleotide-binding domain-containing protein [Pseudomonadota bacterium]MBU1686119.1 cyclic nucleotide-binding domain-containing protein [Pseudomonadota bacterium]